MFALVVLLSQLPPVVAAFPRHAGEDGERGRSGKPPSVTETLKYPLVKLVVYLVMWFIMLPTIYTNLFL